MVCSVHKLEAYTNPLSSEQVQVLTFCVFIVETYTELRDLVCKFISPNLVYKTVLALSIHGTVKVLLLAREKGEN